MKATRSEAVLAASSDLESCPHDLQKPTLARRIQRLLCSHGRDQLILIEALTN